MKSTGSNENKTLQAAADAFESALEAHGLDLCTAEVAWDFLRQVADDGEGVYEYMAELPAEMPLAFATEYYRLLDLAYVNEITPLAPGPEPEIKFEGIQPQGAKPASGTLTTSQSQFMLAQLIAAIEVVKAAETHSQLIGRPVSFGSEDIRAFAISGFISRDREAGR